MSRGNAEGRTPLEVARSLLVSVLEGSVTPASHPWLIDEDELMFCVAAVCDADPEWLLEQLGNRRHAFEARATVFYAMLQDRERALDILRRENPDFLR